MEVVVKLKENQPPTGGAGGTDCACAGAGSVSSRESGPRDGTFLSRCINTNFPVTEMCPHHHQPLVVIAFTRHTILRLIVGFAEKEAQKTRFEKLIDIKMCPRTPGFRDRGGRERAKWEKPPPQTNAASCRNLKSKRMRTEWPIRKKGGVLNRWRLSHRSGAQPHSAFSRGLPFPASFSIRQRKLPGTGSDCTARREFFVFYHTHTQKTLREPFSIPAETVRWDGDNSFGRKSG